MKMMLRISIAVCGLIIVLGGLGTIKGLQIGRMVAQSESYNVPLQTVAAATVGSANWEDTLTAVGTLEAVQGVMVTAEVSGKVSRIAFSPGARVQSGQLLVQQDISEEQARLRAADSRLRLATKNLERARLLNKEQVITDSILDENLAAFEQAKAEYETIQAVISKKTITAPFAGRLGIRRVDLGEVLESGQEIVSLQSMDPVFVNFYLPQQQLIQIETGLRVRAQATVDGKETFYGRITTINPDVNPDTRNVQIQATLENDGERLRPGMFARVQVLLPERQPVLTVPATAVLYAPYGDSVFVVEPVSGESGQSGQVLQQRFVQLGEKRGDFVSVVNGLEAGQMVVSTGVFKLRNGMPVVVDNSLAPPFETNPQPENA
jgi:membrane fusion protein (multidrug efflux system)